MRPELLIAAVLLAICLPVRAQGPEDHSKDLDRCASAWVEVGKTAGGHSFKDLLNLETFRTLYDKLPEADREICIRVGKERLGAMAAAARGQLSKTPQNSTGEEAKPPPDSQKQ
jgi:hypothetical protein